MHSESTERWQHQHVFLGADHTRNERRTWLVIVLTALMMVFEIAAGAAFGSMALLADGFHMATHAGALAIAALAYSYARRNAHDDRFTFGTGKLGELAGYSSAVILAFIAILIGFESAVRLASPVAIQFDEAIAVAIIGLGVNLVSAWLLHQGEAQGRDEHQHHDDNSHGHHHGHVHQDNNLRAAYFHVLADALTSVLAIAGLLAGRFYGWLWMDPLMGIVGAIIIARWSWGLLRDASSVLLDMTPDRDLKHRIRDSLELEGDRITDLHLWRVGPGHLALIISIMSDRPQTPEYYKDKLVGLAQFSHVTIEPQPCARRLKHVTALN